MTREELQKELQSIDNPNLLLELTTGFGKSKCALDLIVKYRPESVLIIIPRLVLVTNWTREFEKFGLEEEIKKVTFCCYQGLHNYVKTEYDMVIYDECHHITENNISYIHSIKRKYNVLLSATVDKDTRFLINHEFNNLKTLTVSLREAIDLKVLPDPTVYLLPLELDNENYTEIKTVRSYAKRAVTVIYNDPKKWDYLKNKNFRVDIKCTQYQYINELNSEISYYKSKSYSPQYRQKWLRLCGNRLAKLADYKESVIKSLHDLLDNEKTLTFCNSIEQTKRLCDNAINSKNKQSTKLIKDFNEDNIKHLSSVNMLNEGITLEGLRVGIFCVLNSSEIMIKQKNGRLLRHNDPIIIIPYYENTRESEIVDSMLENYSIDNIMYIENINSIKL